MLVRMLMRAMRLVRMLVIMRDPVRMQVGVPVFSFMHMIVRMRMLVRVDMLMRVRMDEIAVPVLVGMDMRVGVGMAVLMGMAVGRIMGMAVFGISHCKLLRERRREKYRDGSGRCNGAGRPPAT